MVSLLNIYYDNTHFADLLNSNNVYFVNKAITVSESFVARIKHFATKSILFENPVEMKFR